MMLPPQAIPGEKGHNGFQQPAGEVRDPSHSMRVRLRLLQIVLLVLFAVVALRLFQIQVIESQSYRTIAQKQYRAKIDLPASRGMLFDRNGTLMASNSMFVSFAADPKLAAEDVQTIAATFSRVFKKPKSYYLNKLQSDSRFVWLERQVDVETADLITARKLNGVVVRNEPKRIYYHGPVGGQLVGSTNIDNEGIAGVELEFDNDLRGTNGWVVFQRDGRGKAFPSVEYPRVEPQNGNNVTLSIDIGLQAIAEKELKKGVESSHAKSGLVVMLQPRTGEILAMAQYPFIDPNMYGKYPPEDQRLRSVTDLFEPGSVFKIVTTSAALEYKLVRPENKFFAENGTYKVAYGTARRTITDTHKEGWITFQQALEVSSNIVMAKVSDIIGSEKLYKVARDYGFGTSTEVGFPGEVGGVLKKPKDWSGLTLNTIAYGYEVSVSPIQIAAAYGAVANGGVLMKPYLLEKVTDPNGKLLRTSQPQPIRRIVSEATVKTLTDFFEGVVLRGTAKMAAMPGLQIAGKTGTSRKMVNGHYVEGSYTASFVGFLPADNPELVCLVMMDDPRGVFYTGGTTSAPVFRNIITQVLNSTSFLTPPAEQQLFVQAAAEAEDTDKAAAADDHDAGGNAQPRTGVIPDVRGNTLRQAMNVLMNEKLIPVVSGSGVVVHQSPEAGQTVKPGMKVLLTCQPKGAAFVPVN